MINLGLYYGKSKGEVFTDHKTVGAFVTEASGMFPDVRITVDDNVSFEFHKFAKTKVEDLTEIQSLQYINHWSSEDGITLEIRIRTKTAPEKIKCHGWTNIFKYNGHYITSNRIYDTEEEAKDELKELPPQFSKVYMKPIHVEWEEEIK